MEGQQAQAAHANGDAAPKVAIKGADGGPVASESAPQQPPKQPEPPQNSSIDTPFRAAAVAEEHSTIGPAVPEGDEQARAEMEAQKSQQPWAKGMTDTAMHTPLQRDSDRTSKDVGPSEAGHARRWIKVPKGWWAKRGNFVFEGLYIGEALGKGMQVRSLRQAYSASPLHAVASLGLGGYCHARCCTSSFWLLQVG